jgi:metal-responsive CopG/Arc/MetJ family transcriptional regulator
MTSIKETKKPKKGRPTVESEAINLRLTADIMSAIDEWRRQQDEIPNRQEAIRQMLRSFLKI